MTTDIPASRCDGYKFWMMGNQIQDWEAEAAGFGQCGAVRPRWKITDEIGGERCFDQSDEQAMTPEERMDARVDERRAALKDARAYVQDGSEYRAEFFTAPDFFCALFQPRQTQP